MSGLEKCLLFKGISEKELPYLLSLAGARQSNYATGDIILHQGEHTEKLGVVLYGSAEALVYSSEGAETSVAKFGEGDVFADFLAADDSHSSPVTIIACEGTRVLHIPFFSIISPQKEMGEAGNTMLSNLVRIYAQKYFDLKNRLICVTKPSLRDKICAALALYGNGNTEIILPYTRDQFARYLNADRSALSRELSRMKAEGLISFRKNIIYVHSVDILDR